MPDIVCFPADLQNTTGSDKQYAQIEFTVQGSPDKGRMFNSIYLPCPAGIMFQDSGQYSTMDLGAIAGAGGQDALASMMQGNVGDSARAVGDMAGQGLSSIWTKVKTYAASKVAQVDKDKAMFAIKKVNAPNTNTTFMGNNLRKFNFTMELIARTKEDTAAARAIHTMLRRYAYAGADAGSPNIILDYPPLWKVSFLIDGRENNYLPKIFACYLTSLSTTFNQKNNVFHLDDGSPFDLSLALEFTESRVLNRIDIDALEAGNSNRGINPKTGLATVSTNAALNVPPPSPQKSTPPARPRSTTSGPQSSVFGSRSF